MNKRERVVAAIRGERVDCVPSGFSIHFPEGCKEGQAAVNAHLRFFQETDTDIIKIMNENLVPYMGEIEKPEDFRKYRILGPEEAFITDQVRLTREILSGADPEAFSLGTLIKPAYPLKKPFRTDPSGFLTLTYSKKIHPSSPFSLISNFIIPILT